MSHRPFARTLALRMPNRGVYVADSVWELEQYLELFWPEDDTDLPRLLRLAHDSLDGWLSPEKVRAEAEAAARRLGLLSSQRPDDAVRYRAVNQSWRNLNATA